MRIARAILTGVVLAVAPCLMSAPRPGHVTPNSPGGITGYASTGCGQCHLASQYVIRSISGPSQVAAGAQQIYSFVTQYNTTCGAVAPGVCPVGLDLASTTPGLAVNDTGIQLLNNEITHILAAKSLAADQMGSVTYSFKYTMPNKAPGSAETLYGAARVGKGGWAFAPSLNVVVPLGASPSSVSIIGSSSGSLKLQWGGPASAAYQITYKQGAISPSSPGDGIKKPLVFNQNTLEVTGLSPNTQYSFSVWGASEKPAGVQPGTQLYSANPPAQVTGTTAPLPPSTFPLLRTGSMGTARFGQTATLLANGKVLIAGGQDALNPLQSAELYDPATGTFSYTGSMAVARNGHTATSLPNGKVLITGGTGLSVPAELYDPVAGTFSNTGTMAATRTGHTATLLNSGKVLIAGGNATIAAGELYDPSAGTFGPTLNMTAFRFNHTATLLPNGKVLLAGGSPTVAGSPVNTAEVYDPAGNSFTATGNTLSVARKNHTATALILGNSGQVSLIGGTDTAGNSINSTETYDSASNTFTANTTGPYATARHTATLLPYVGTVLITGGRASNGSSLDTMQSDSGSFAILSEPRAAHTATVLADGRVLIAGGVDSANSPISSADLYDPNLYILQYPIFVDGAFFATGNMTSVRFGHTATLLPNGKVLIAGGFGCSGEGQTAELYDGTFTATTGTLVVARAKQTATLLPNGKVLLAAGEDPCSSTPLNSAELFDPVTQTFTATGPLPAARSSHTATLLANGKVLIAGGRPAVGLTSVAQAVLYDPDSGTFSATGNMVTPRENHTATLLPNGKVLIAGGNDETNTLFTAELYNPASGTFSASNATVFYQNPREDHLAALLPNGKVLVAEGRYGALSQTNPCSALLYDPATDDYGLAGCFVGQTNVPGQNGGRYRAAATMLPDGRVLIVGGTNEGGNLTTAEVYDPAFNVSRPVSNSIFVSEGSMTTARGGPTATLLPDGKVLIAGGVGPAGYLNTAETFQLFKAPTAPRPVISSAPATLFLPASVTISGTGLRANWEAGQGSPSDLPILQLQRVDDGRIVLLRPATRNATVFTSTIQSGLPDGTYRVTIISDGVASISSVVTIRTVPLVGPTSLNAAAASATSVNVTWAAVNGAATYEIIRSEDHINYVSRGTVAGTSLPDSALSGKAYLYKVHAFDALGSLGPDSSPDLATTVIFDDDPVVAGTTPARAVHITQLRTAVDAVRTLAGLTGGSYAEAITAGSTTIKASHILELRSALNPARSALGLMALSYTDPSLTGGFLIKAAHINELRSGVK